MTTPTNIILIITATAAALIAGLFYAWACSVTPGLARVPDQTYIAAMQSMNRAILNPVFFITFLGTALLLPLSTYLHYGHPIRFWLLLTATILYIIGVFGVTMVGNVPLNDALDAFPLYTASAQEIAALRARFETPWNNLNLIRTVASVVTIILVIIACINND